MTDQPTADDVRAVYSERAHLVAHLAARYPAVLLEQAPDDPDWALVYITLPTGQLSWHISAADLHLFAHVERVTEGDPRGLWDGHSTAEKYTRLALDVLRVAGRRRTRDQ
jgi:hypothetical protein